MKRGSNLSRRALALGLAACAHVLALLALGLRIPHTRLSPLAEAARLQMTILRRPRPVRPTGPRESRRRQPPSPPPAAPPQEVAPPVLTQPAPEPAPPPPSDREQLRGVLRGLLGCGDPDAYHLTHDERDACAQRLAAARPAGVQKQFSPEEVAGFEADRQESILTRKPKNGCLPRLGDHPSPSSIPNVRYRSGATTAVGLGCAKSF